MAKQRRNVVGQPGQARAGGFFSKGVDLKAKGEYSRAATSFTQHIERYPSHVGAYIQRSSCFLKLGLVESALIDAQLATELDPSSDKAIVAKADALLELEQLDEALVLYGDLFSRTTPDHPDRYRYKYGLQQCLEGKKATSFREGMEGVAMTLPSAAPESSVRSSVSPFPPSPSSARRSADEIEVSKVLADSAVNDILLRRVRMYSNEGDYKCVKQKVGADAKLRHVPSSITAKNTIPITVGSDRGASLFPTSGVSGNDAASRSRSGSPSKYSSRDNLSAGLDSLFMKSLGSERREEVRRARRMGKHVEGATEAKKLDEYFYFQDEIKVLDQSVEDRSKAAKTRRELLHKYRGQAFRTAQAMTSSSPLSPSNYQEPTLARLNGGGGTVIAPFDDGQRRGSPIEHPHRPEPPSQPRRPASAKHVRSSGGGVRNKRRLLSARQRGQQESDVQRTEIVEAYASLPTSRLAVRVEHRGSRPSTSNSISIDACSSSSDEDEQAVLAFPPSSLHCDSSSTISSSAAPNDGEGKIVSEQERRANKVRTLGRIGLVRNDHRPHRKDAVDTEVQQRARMIPMGQRWLASLIERKKKIPDKVSTLTLRDRIRSSFNFLVDNESQLR